LATVGFAVLGLGNLAQTAILPAFRGTQQAKLVAVVSRDLEKARRMASLHGSAYAYDSLDECLANPQVEAVYIATPPGTHLQEVTAVARAGRHVLCEKPLAVTAPDAAEMVSICARQSVRLMTAYRKCFEPSMVFIRDLILSGRLGALKILHTSFSERHARPQTSPPWILDRRLAGGGPLMDLGIYCVHAARWLAGEIPSSVSAFQWTHDRSLFREVEEGIAFSMCFPSGLSRRRALATALPLVRCSIWRGLLGQSASPQRSLTNTYACSMPASEMSWCIGSFPWWMSSDRRSRRFLRPFGADLFHPPAGRMVMSTWQSSKLSTVPPRPVFLRQSN
jgi:predicted dehydrogenase